MSTNPRDSREDDAEAMAPAGTIANQAYEPPKLIEHGPLAKITQTTIGSTGESANMTMRKCL
jgi:hypothetical protein